MKSKISLLAVILSLFFCNAFAQKSNSEQNENSIYEQQMTKLLEKARSTKEPMDLFESVNELKRLGAMYPTEWLPDYYISYLELKLSFLSDNEKKEALMDDVKQKIDGLLDKKGSISSEVYTLQGYYYYTKIAHNTEGYGQLYYKEVIGSYQKAINIDKNNPRPSYLLNLFQNNMSRYLGSKDESFCEKLESNHELFKKYKIKSINDPNWGEQELLKVIETTCSNKASTQK
jgi:hypothetical protein